MSAAKIQNAASAPPRAAMDARSASETHGESFGAFLRRERELRGVSLDQIADETRILVANLKALEEDDRSRLPERVFVLGYIRAYAKAVGIDANEAVLRYDEYLQSREPPPAMTLALPRRKSRTGHIALFAALLALGVAVIVCLKLALGPRDEKSDLAPSGEEVAQPAAAAPEATPRSPRATESAADAEPARGDSGP